MSPENNPLKLLAEIGQSVWLDFVSRGLLRGGGLHRLIEADGVSGVTSNPSIFEKAIAETTEYDDDLNQFATATEADIGTLFEHLAIADIREAADALRPTYDATNRHDGYVSLEVSPYLALDTRATIAEARRLWKQVARENLMIKVPGTEAGVPAIRTLIGEGINVNVTLLFSLDAYDAVAEAYLLGLEDRAAAGGDLAKVASVASFFVSRIDIQVDRHIDAKLAAGGDRALLERLRGKVAIANAKLAYQHFKQRRASSRWQALAQQGAQPQRLLWASTGTKNKAYSDVLYVEALIGPETVDTMPPATMDAFRDHGTVANRLEEDVDGALHVMEDLKLVGISLDEITAHLVTDGVRQFAEAADKLYAAIARKRAAMLGGGTAREAAALDEALTTAVAAELEIWRVEGKVRRLWAKDKSLWTNSDEDRWLGWLEIVDQELADIAQLKEFAQAVRTASYRDVVLLGMGGSSLGPEVLAQTFGPIAGWPRFHMLDSTDPAQIRHLEEAIDIGNALFIVSSKSGSTLEPNIFRDYFLERVRQTVGRDAAGARFVAVTDPGSSLEAAARRDGFGHVFHGVPTIGGRYSVLSKFGLVPAAAIGIDVGRMLRRTRTMVTSCGPLVPPEENPGVRLGVVLGVAARQGRNKVTIFASPDFAHVGGWLEQLIAESTGKQGKGLIPIDGEPPGSPEIYGTDRIFVHLRSEASADPAADAAVAALEAAGHPVLRFSLREPFDLGPLFFQWELAIAVVGAILGINSFDQPDVEASKRKTQELMAEYEKTGRLPAEQPVYEEDGVSLFADPRNADELGRANALTDYLRAHFGRLSSGDYAALLAYVERNDAHDAVLQAARLEIRDVKRVATCLGYGPRFLHSTGQAYKGGPNIGVFLQITCDDAQDIPVPGHRYSFGVVKAAQARGDFDVLAARGRRALRVHLKDVDQGLRSLGAALDQALS